MQTRKILCHELDLFCFLLLLFFFYLENGYLDEYLQKKKTAKFYNQVVCIEKLGLFITDM